jgi:hypothetical protein
VRIGCVRRVIRRSIIVVEFNEAGILDTIGLGVSDWKNDPFAQIAAQPKIQFNGVPDVRLAIIGTDARRAVGSTVMLPPAPMLPDRNVNDEICPSPRARRLRMNRHPSTGAPD